MKLTVQAKIWCLIWFKYAEFIGDVNFSFWAEILFLGKFGPKN